MVPCRSYPLVLLVVVGLTASAIQAMAETYAQDTTKHETRIIDGTITTIDKLPWQVLVNIISMNATHTETERCGGSIISRSWILTAAHCFVKGKTADAKLNATGMRIEVFAGITTAFFVIPDPADPDMQGNIYDTNDIEYHLSIHPAYNKGTVFNNDIALLKLKKQLTINKKVQTITLANENDFFKPGKELIASGWGFINDNGPFSHTLQYVDGLHLKSWEWCYNYWDNLNITFTENMICHFTRNRNVCQGDSGGPVVTSIGSNNGPPYVQVGIVSFGYRGGCATNPMESTFQSSGFGDILPSIFTDVTKFGKWINETISSFQE